MPLFEYRCRSCETRFEEFVLGEDAPRCPSCDGGSLQKLLSVFAVGNGSGSPKAAEAPSACGSCGDPRGPGACSID
jgi:putative FmdB family regulatory protein